MIRLQPERFVHAGILYAYDIELDGKVFSYLSHHETDELNHVFINKIDPNTNNYFEASYDELKHVQEYLSQSGYPI